MDAFDIAEAKTNIAATEQYTTGVELQRLLRRCLRR